MMLDTRSKDYPRISGQQVQDEINHLLEMFGHKEKQFLYQYLADALGVHHTTILRYHRGDLRTAPATLLCTLSGLRQRLESGETVLFLKGRKRRPVVLRRQTALLVDRMMESGLYPSRTWIFRRVDKRLGLRRGTMARLYRNREAGLASARILAYLEHMHREAEYDPSMKYQLDDRLMHPEFGIGTVIELIGNERIRVHFEGGNDRQLCHGIAEDPCWAQRAGADAFFPGGGTSSSYYTM